jgi:hypothetical protein
MRSSVKDFRYAFEWLLTRSVPYLQFKNLLFELNKQSSELHAYSDLMISEEFVVSQPME